MRPYLLILAAEVVMGAVLFGAAGRVDLPWIWAVLGVHFASMLVGVTAMDPGLRRERLKPGGPGRDVGMRKFAGPFIVAHLVVAGLDVGRYGWTGPLPWGVQAGALALYAAGLGLAYWSMAANRFFSPIVRLQTERGHHLIDGGPYRFVRHPGYVGLVVAMVAGGLAIGSAWSIVPLVPLMLLVVARTRVEDRFLRAELAGYAEYAGRVRSRLVPGVW